MRDYAAFISGKFVRMRPSGREIHTTDIHGPLYPFQRDVVRWAVRLGRACIFADCGLGKTLMQLEWAYHVPGRVLILTPLAVSAQTEAEARRFGYRAAVVASQDDVQDGISITNYEKMDRFDVGSFEGVVLDESSILKAYDGATRTKIITTTASVPWRLACTATPSPNDLMELGNHAEFVGAMTRTEMLAMFFVHDGGSTQNWRLKGHAESRFWEWVSSWAVMFSRPSDLGYDDDGFVLPPIRYEQHTADDDFETPELFAEHAVLSMIDRRRARTSSIAERVAVAADLAKDGDRWLMWCDLNEESRQLAAAIPDAVEVKGSDTSDHKASSMLGFAAGDIRVLVTKPSIAGFGMNWQVCNKMAFVGLSDSYEALYQATRRCWRYGQKKRVEAHIITSRSEGPVLRNVQRKERDHTKMQDALSHMVSDHINLRGTPRRSGAATMETRRGNGWTMVHGDCVEALRELDNDSVGYSVFSPPFASLYVYSDDERDMGNCQDHEEFMGHFGFLLDELYRCLQPGRLVSMHCMLLPTSKVRDGVIGLHDFRGDLIRAAEARGFVFHSEVVIWKDPVTAMQRTKALGLLHKQIRKDSAMSRQGVPDYVVTMRKPGENANPIAHTSTEFPVSLWQKWASPIWTDINPSDTLQFASARDEQDERHICPLQLEVIKRCLGLWSNPGDLVLSPFAGIGSEGYVARQWSREFYGVELKRSYFDEACRNLDAVELAKNQQDLFK